MPVVRGAQARSLPGSLETLAVLGGGRSGEKYENPIGWNGLLYILYITLHYSILRFDYCGELRQSLSNMGIFTIKNGNRNMHSLT